MTIYKRLFYSFYFCIISFIPSNAFSVDDWVVIAEKNKASVVTVLSYDSKGEMISQGSGFFIGVNRLVTNYHVIERANTAKIKTVLGETFIIKGVLAENKELDLAILSVDIPEGYMKPLQLSNTLPKEGQDILIIGSPLGLELTVSNGIVSSLRKLPGFEDIIQITAPISPGSSGSPVFDRTGMVIGVVVSQIISGQNLNFAIPASSIQELKEGDLQTFTDFLSKIKKSENDEAIKSELDKGWLANVNKNYNEAIIHLNKVIELDPQNSWAYQNLGDAYIGILQYKKAIEFYQQAILFNSDAKFSYEFIAYLKLGDAYLKLNQQEKANIAFSKGIEIVKKDTKRKPAEINSFIGVFYERMTLRKKVRLAISTENLFCTPLDSRSVAPSEESNPRC